MKKTYNKGGDAAFLIKTEHVVSAEHFINAIAQYCWEKDKPFNPKMTKREAMNILKESLFHYGLRGPVDYSLYEGASDEAVDGYVKAVPLIKEWVLKNYPYLDSNYYDGK